VSSDQDVRATWAAPLAVTDRPPSCQHIAVLTDLAGMGGKPPLMASGMDIRLAPIVLKKSARGAKRRFRAGFAIKMWGISIV
jgi:hypothetical protein